MPLSVWAAWDQSSDTPNPFYHLTMPIAANKPFEVVSSYQPAGDQPEAINALTCAIESGQRHACLLGATGTGKTFTMAHTIARVNKPTLVLSHNKTLAAQLFEELKAFFPNNSRQLLRFLLRLLPARSLHPRA